jgi:hypothetical protein
VKSASEQKLPITFSVYSAKGGTVRGKILSIAVLTKMCILNQPKSWVCHYVGVR